MKTLLSPPETQKVPSTPLIIRGTVCHLIDDPFMVNDEIQALDAIEDGAIAIDDQGKISAIGQFLSTSQTHPDWQILDRSGCLIIPGLVDCHMHLPQALILGAFGEELLSWLEKYIFPEEDKYRCPEYAARAASLFFDETIAQGTTTALIFGPNFEQATDLSFAAAQQRRFRAVMGMTLSDRNVPQSLQLTAEQAYETSLRLIQKWHLNGKAKYVITPRFAPSCSDDLLRTCRRLLDEIPELYLQTHINENSLEIQWVSDLYPQVASYAQVYDQFGLLGPRSILAHSIHSTDAEIALFASRGSAVAHCPCSNSFLGSGIFPLKKHLSHGVKVGLGSDVAAGTSYSLLNGMNQAYKLQMLSRAVGNPDDAIKLSGIKLLYLATLSGARALQLDSEIGNFAIGKCADLLIVDPTLDPYAQARFGNTSSIIEKLFVLATIGSKNIIREVFIDGAPAHAHA